MAQRAQKAQRSGWPEILRAIQTPLGFFALALLIVDAMIGVVAARCADPYRSYLLFAALAVILVLVSVVALLTHKGSLNSQASIGKAFLHHVSLPVRDLTRSLKFYTGVLALKKLPRDELAFGVGGAWLGFPSGQQVHLLQNLSATFPAATDEAPAWHDAHFAIRVPDVQEIIGRLNDLKIKSHINPPVTDRYPHVYVRDPDGHVIEFNSEKK